jgi:hypothetical protein
MTRFKGPMFNSYHNQNGQPKKVLVWKPGTQSIRQQVKNLKLKCSPILDSRDPAVLAVAQRAVKATLDEPNPVFGYLHLFAAGMDAAVETGKSWTDCMTEILDAFDRKDGVDPVELVLQPATVVSH